MPSTRRSNSARISRSSSSGSSTRVHEHQQRPVLGGRPLCTENDQAGVRGGPDRVADEPEGVGALQPQALRQPIRAVRQLGRRHLAPDPGSPS